MREETFHFVINNAVFDYNLGISPDEIGGRGKKRLVTSEVFNIRVNCEGIHPEKIKGKPCLFTFSARRSVSKDLSKAPIDRETNRIIGWIEASKNSEAHGHLFIPSDRAEYLYELMNKGVITELLFVGDKFYRNKANIQDAVFSSDIKASDWY